MTNPEDAREGARWDADTVHHLVQIQRSVFADGKVSAETDLIAPIEALEFAERLAASARRALHSQLVDLRRGDCPTCLNLRLIEIPATGDRTTQVYVYRIPD